MKRYILFLLATLLSAAVPGQTAARTDSLAQHPQSEQTASAAYASDPDKLWDQANTAYINNDFPTAISLYETILSSGRQSGKLYYNLANAYFKEQEIGRAILNYNRALRLNPGNEDIRYNLQVAEKMTKDHIDAVPVDTWIEQILTKEYLPKHPIRYRRLPKSRLYTTIIQDFFGSYKGYAGVMQQYIFYYERSIRNGKF